MIEKSPWPPYTQRKNISKRCGLLPFSLLLFMRLLVTLMS